MCVEARLMAGVWKSPKVLLAVPEMKPDDWLELRDKGKLRLWLWAGCCQ